MGYADGHPLPGGYLPPFICRTSVYVSVIKSGDLKEFTVKLLIIKTV